uniref:Cytochrome c oxidase subunit 4 n=1 Tax=Lygus hesperus TaxID=30085 RepID=A0A0A9ZCH1_LYGHE
MKSARFVIRLAAHVVSAEARATVPSGYSGIPWRSSRQYASHPGGNVQYPHKIGMREIVGFGMNGKPDYIDSSTFPYPAIRFREITPDFKALKEKEKGSWKILTLNEKKCLYRISFCKTIAEIEAPTGEWKKVLGSTLLFLSMSIWFYMFIIFMIRDELPETFKYENQVAQLKRMLDLKMNPIDGISSKWDYEANTWKGKGSSSDKKDKKDSKSKEK